MKLQGQHRAVHSSAMLEAAGVMILAMTSETAVLILISLAPMVVSPAKIMLVAAILSGICHSNTRYHS